MKNYFAVLFCLSSLLFIFLVPISASAVDFDTESLYQSVFTIKTGTALGSGFAIDKTHIITILIIAKKKTKINI